MIKLYDTGNAQDFDLESEAFHESDWEAKSNTIRRLLVAKKCTRALEFFNKYDFQLYEATNHFNDPFKVLLAIVSIDEYVEIETNHKNIITKKEVSELVSIVNKVAGYTRFVVIDFKQGHEIEVVKNPEPKITSNAVEIALKDAENLLQTRGPISAVDRIHTALHGYIRTICVDSNITSLESSNIITLFGVLRQHHPIFAEQRDNTEVNKILKSISTIIDSINTIRNKSSIAHPNEVLLDESEAILAINCSRSLLHYLDSKLNKQSI